MEKIKHSLVLILVFMALLMIPLLAHADVANGVVIEAGTDEPIIGASILEQGTTNGTITDFDGNFTLNVAPGATLVVSYVGYKSQTLPAGTNLRIQLAEDSEVLEEVVVTGYTTQRKADLTGAVSAVSAKDLEKQQENNPMKALQGKVPGMNITADGSPSGAAMVRIRGIGTLNDNDPLYIIDGVPTKSGMHELNPNDIESIQVLKDAASASIYGSRAANGVIIITTKKGAEGKIRVDLDASVAVQSYTNRMHVLDAKQFGQVMWQAYVNDNMNPNTNALGYHYDWGYNAQGYPMLNAITMSKYLDDAGTVPAANTDWFKETTRPGVIQNYNVSVSNGSQKGSSFFSLGYYKNEGIIKCSDFDRFSARVNSDYKIIGDYVSIGENFTLNRTSEVSAPGGFLENVLQFNPSLPVYTTEGEYAGPVGGYPDRENPVARLNRNKDNRYTYWRLFGNAFINITPFKGFNIRTTAGIDYAQKKQRIFTYPITEGTMANDKNAVEAKQEHWFKWMWNAIVTYNMEIGKHRADFLLGTELNRQQDEWFSGYKEGFIVLDPNYMWPDAGVGTAQAYGSAGSYSLISFFGKANYTYDNRYLVSFTLRHDGSSRFGKNNRFATFPSVSAGWRISQEKFMAGASPWVDDLKIRASWGQTGNQDISPTARYTIYVSNYGVNESGGQSYGTSYDITGSNGGGILPSGFKRNQIGNDDIKWETTTQTNAGVDFSFFKQTFYGSFDWFYKQTKDILVLMDGIGAMGEGSAQWVNAGAMDNMGVELSLGYRNQTKDGFKYDISANLSSYRNTVTKLPETIAAKGTFGGNGVKSVVGHAMGSQVGYIADGIFKSQEEVDNHAYQEGAAVGRIRYRDLNGDGMVTEADQDWIYSPVPAVMYGANFYFEYKGFDLTVFFQGVAGVDVITDLKRETDIWAGLNIGFLNKGTRLLDAWSPTNPNSNIPALSLSDNNNEKRVSTYWVENGSFLKLRNVQLGYNLPKDISAKMKMENWRFFVSAQNVFTIHSKNFTGVDPENPNFGYPIPLTMTLGTKVTF
ncbi:MAG: TonB-dependent receptor [Bacteroidales bacterium]|jgi:TonB-linked SusC/RagA family outer membrane protein|nr:TonB-dependent receptor [Bacteroidales bacterium]MBR4460557.1 TonB-dependent receptor [Paludibacteraceae bacterium]